MSDVGQIERNTQNRIVQLFRERLNYDYLGDWQYREDNRNVEEKYLRSWMEQQGYEQALINKAVYQLVREASMQMEDLYDSNKKGYHMLRYGSRYTGRQGRKKAGRLFYRLGASPE